MHLHRTGQRTAIFIAAISVGTMLAECAHAQENCASRESLVAQLAEEFGEHQSSVAIKDNVLIEVFSAPDGSTWTILETHPNGISCVIEFGEHWTDFPKGWPS